MVSGRPEDAASSTQTESYRENQLPVFTDGSP